MLPFSRMITPGVDPDLYDTDQPEYEFGTGTGRQGRFNPRDPRQQQMAIQRLKELQQSYGEKLTPGYTGFTGYGDMGSYAQHQNAVVEAQNIQNLLGGDEPLGVKFGGFSTGPKAGGDAARMHRTAILKLMDQGRR